MYRTGRAIVDSDASRNGADGSVCTACGGRLEVFLGDVRDPLTSERFAVHRCAACGLGHTVPHPADIGRYYGPAYYGGRHGVTDRYCVRRRLRFVSCATAGRAGSRLLDVGCGDGAFLVAARAAGWEGIGIERNPAPARSAGLDVLPTIAEASDRGPFDCITLWHSLEHMPDIAATLAQLAGLLGPRGILLVAVPDNGSIQARLFGRHWLHLDVPRHLYHFDAVSLSSCLGGAGLRIQRQWHQEIEYDLIGWSQSALNCVMPVPNVFLEVVSGKRGRGGAVLTCLPSVLVGILLTALFLPAVVVGGLIRRGGTLIVVAVRDPGARTS